MSAEGKEEDDRTVLVSNIAPEIGLQHLRDLFTVVGRVLDLSFVASQGIAWIEYDKPDSAKAAEYLSGTQLGDKKLQVVVKANLPKKEEQEAKEKEAAAAAAATAAATATAAAVALASPPAPQLGINPLLPSNQPLLGMGMISPSAAAGGAALLPFNQPLLSPSASTAAAAAATTPLQQLLASFAQPLQAAGLGMGMGSAQFTGPVGSSSTSLAFMSNPLDPASSSRTVYVGNLSLEVTEAYLVALFAPVGQVVATRFSGDNATSTRYAFVEFATQAQANLAHGLNNTLVIDRNIRVGKAQSSITKGGPPQVAGLLQLQSQQQQQQQPLLSMSNGFPPSAALARADPSKVAAAMEKVRKAQEAIARKFVDPSIPLVAGAAGAMGSLPPTPTAAAAAVASSLLGQLGYGPTPAAAPLAAQPAATTDESKAEPSPSASRSSRSRSRTHSRSRSPHSRSRTRSRSPQQQHRRPDWGERQRMREQQQQQQRQGAGAGAPAPSSNDRWGGGPAPRSPPPPSSSSSSSRRDSSHRHHHHRDRDRDRDRDRRHHHHRRSRSPRRSRSRSRSPHDRDRDRDYHHRRPHGQQQGWGGGGGGGKHGGGGYGHGHKYRVPGAVPAREGMAYDGFQWLPAVPIVPAAGATAAPAPPQQQ